MEQLTIASLDQARTMINGAHHKAMTSFIELGHIFRQVGDNRLYEEGGYSSLADFAKEEYNYSQSQVSRFISLNMEFSIGGNTPILAEKYEKFSQTKLVEMLQIPEEVRENIEPEMKRDEIRELREDIEEANEKAQEEDFEAAITGSGEEDHIDRVIIPLLINKKAQFHEIYKQIENTGSEEDIRMAFSPSGFGFVKAGSGMVFLKDQKVIITISNVNRDYTYHDLINAIIKKLEPWASDAPADEAEYFEALTGEKLEDEKPSDNVKNADSEKKETPKPKKETKTKEKPEVKHCETESETVEQPEEKKQEPDDSLEVIESETPPEEEAITPPHTHETKALTHKVIGKVFGDTKKLHIYRTGEDGKGDYDEPLLVAAFEIVYCPFCGEKL